MYGDPPAPMPRAKDETVPTATQSPFDSTPVVYVFNPAYERLVMVWQSVLPALDKLNAALDKSYNLATSPQTWDAPVGKRYVQDISEWRSQMILYRHAILTTISDEARGTPRWIPSKEGSPSVYP
jgi:hypothetical protein